MIFKDLVIVLPGISGSVPSKDGKEVWGASTAAIWQAVTSGGESIRSLSIKGADDPSLDDLGDGVKATSLVQDLHIIPGLWKIDGYTALVKRLTSSLQLARVYDAQSGALSQEVVLAPDGDTFVARTRLPPGAYRAKVTAEFPSNPVTVTEAFLIVS